MEIDALSPVDNKNHAKIVLLAVGFYCHHALGGDNYFNLSLKELSEITVSSPFPESYLTASSSVSIVQADQWQEQGSRRIVDVLATLPSTMTYPSIGVHAVAFRGFSNSSSSVRGIATQLDGVPLSGFSSGTALYTALQFDVDSLSQMQVLRGPSSALYGSEAFHGVIALQSFQSDVDLQKVSAQLGSDLYWRSTWNSSVGVGNGWRLESSVGVSEKPGEGRRYQFTDVTTLQPGTGEFDYRYNAQTLMAKLRSPVSESGASYGVGVYSNRYIADDWPGLGQSLKPGASLDGAKDLIDADTSFDMVKANARWRLAADSELLLQTYYWDSGIESTDDFTENPSRGDIYVSRTKDSRRGIELKLKQRLPAQTDFLLSGSYDSQFVDERTTRDLDASGNVLRDTTEGSDGTGLHTHSLVGQFKTHLFDDALILVYGGRYDHFSTVGEKTTPRAGAIFRIDPQQSVKLFYGRAFRAPSSIELHGITGVLGSPDLKPETIDTWELVYMFQNDFWRAELVGFASDWKNGIKLGACAHATCSAGQLEYQNAIEGKSQGAEFILEASLDRWRLRSSVSYTDSSNDTLVAGQTKTSRYSAFPRELVHLDVGYRFDHDVSVYVANALMRDATEGVGSPTNNFSETPLPTYWRTDLHISKILQRATTVALHVTNLLARKNWQPSVWNTKNGLEDAGRVVEVSLAHRF